MSTQIGRIVVGVTGSLTNLAALHAGVDTARHTGAHLLAVLAWAPVGGELAYRRAPCPILLHIWEELAHERMQTAFEDAFGAVPSDIDLDRVVVRAAAGPALVRRINSPDDALIIGAGRRLGRLHLGVTRYCLKRANCPVIVIEPPEMIRDLRHHHLDEELRTALAGQRR